MAKQKCIKIRVCFIIILLLGFHPTKINSQIEFHVIDKSLGIINQNGDIHQIEYTFINNTNKPIAISHVATSCGCAMPSYDKKPVMPWSCLSIVASCRKRLERRGPTAVRVAAAEKESTPVKDIHII